MHNKWQTTPVIQTVTTVFNSGKIHCRQWSSECYFTVLQEIIYHNIIPSSDQKLKYTTTLTGHVINKHLFRQTLIIILHVS